jgi:hypothetical protein
VLTYRPTESDRAESYREVGGCFRSMVTVAVGLSLLIPGALLIVISCISALFGLAEWADQTSPRGEGIALLQAVILGLLGGLLFYGGKVFLTERPGRPPAP